MHSDRGSAKRALTDSSGQLKGHSNTVSLHQAPEKHESSFCGMYVSVHFNSCYSMKKICDNNMEIMWEKHAMLLKCKITMIYSCCSDHFYFNVQLIQWEDMAKKVNTHTHTHTWISYKKHSVVSQFYVFFSRSLSGINMKERENYPKDPGYQYPREPIYSV